MNGQPRPQPQRPPLRHPEAQLPAWLHGVNIAAGACYGGLNMSPMSRPMVIFEDDMNRIEIRRMLTIWRYFVGGRRHPEFPSGPNRLYAGPY